MCSRRRIRSEWPGWRTPNVQAEHLTVLAAGRLAKLNAPVDPALVPVPHALNLYPVSLAGVLGVFLLPHGNM